MNNMKNIYKAGAMFVVSLLLTGCYAEHISEYSSLRDFTWITSADNTNLDPYLLVEGDFLSFIDVSQGASSHEWIIPEDCGIYFLCDDYIRYDEDDPDTTLDETYYGDLEAMVTGEAKSTTDKKIHCYFTEPGDYEIILRNTYDKCVSWVRSNQNWNKLDEVCYSVLEDGVYVAEQVMNIRVYRSDIEAKMNVYYDNNGEKGEMIELGEVDEDGNISKSIDINYGDVLHFEQYDDDFDNVYSCTWTCSDPVISNTNRDLAITFAPSVPGECLVYLQVKRTLTTFVAESTSETTVVPLIINVKEASGQLDVSASQYGSSAVRISLGNAAFDSESLADYTEGEFTVSYVNGSQSGTIDVASISAVANVNNTITLTLPEETYIYNTDELTVNYTGSSIKVLNNSSATFAVNNIAVASNLSEPLYYTFENSSELDNWILQTNLNGENVSLDYLELPSSDPVIESEDGNSYISFEPDTQTYEGLEISYICTERFDGSGPTTYTLTGKVRAADFSANAYVYFPSMLTESPDYIKASGWAGSNNTIQFSSATSFVDGEWCDFSVTLTTSYATSDIMLNIYTGSSQRGKIDFDDIVLTNRAERPTE